MIFSGLPDRPGCIGSTTPPWALSAWRAVAGAGLLCCGLAMLALSGIGADNALGIRITPLVTTLAGMALVIAPGRGDESL